jgi:nitrate reductase / nitrite oxidoreductase, alpha subunit
MAMGHVILREFLVDRQVPYFTDYLTRFTDAPFLVTLEPSGDAVRPGKFLTANALGEDSEHADFKPVLLDGRTGQPAVPGGSLGFRFGEAGLGRWNLDLGDIVPVLTMQTPDDGEAERVAVDLPRFDADDGAAGMIRRGVPARRIAGHLGHEFHRGT